MDLTQLPLHEGTLKACRTVANVCVCVVSGGGGKGWEDLGASLLAHRQGHQLWGTHTAHTIGLFFRVNPVSFAARLSVHMGVWNEGALTDGGGQVVSGQYHHGPASPNIIWVLNCGVSGLPRRKTNQNRDQMRENKADGVCVKEEDLKVGGRQVESE